MEKEITIRICDLCWSEDSTETRATHQYRSPSVMAGEWFDGCRKHTDQMREAGDYTVRRIKRTES